MLARGGVPLVPEWEKINLSLPPDLEFGNGRSFYLAALESPITMEMTALTSIVSDEMNLCSGSSEIAILKNAGFDLLTFSNNHQEDCHEGGAVETEKLLSSSGMDFFKMVDGFWVADLPDSNISVIAVNDVDEPVDSDEVTRAIEKNKADGKFVVLSVHWGNEYQAGPSKRQLELAQAWSNAGADILWGHHPHVLQRIELLTSNVDGHETLVMYSLGNLLADQFMLVDTQRSALIQVIIEKEQIQRVMIIPVKFDWDQLILDFEPESDERSRILERLDFSNFDPDFVTEFSVRN